MTTPTNDTAFPPLVTFPHDAMVQPEHVMAALRISKEKVEQLNLPWIEIGRDRRLQWGLVLDILAQRAKKRVAA